tara:strand:+ start:2564 stop:3151 length:588 start_codon:yes stop_codon:yes gene_type:complete
VNLFPTLVEEYDLSGSPDFDTFKKIIKEDVESEGEGQTGLHSLACGGKSSHGRWDPFTMSESHPLQHCIIPFLQDYVDTVCSSPLCFGNAWYNVLPPGGFTKRHRHEHSVVSGALYLDLPQNSGNLYFVSPLQQYRMCELFRTECEYNAYEIDMNIKENHLYLFPSWLEHGSRVNESDQDRIMVSFNTSHYTPAA